MILTGPEIAQQIKEGKLEINPFNPKCLGANSYDLVLGSELKVYETQLEYLRWKADGIPVPPGVNMLPTPSVSKFRYPDRCVLDPHKSNKTVTHIVGEQGIILEPGILYLGVTVEWTVTNYPYVPFIEGRSTWGRLGVACHQTAGAGDVGFAGQWVCEISCLTPVLLRPGDKLCQLFFHRVEGARRDYAGRYQRQEGVQEAKPLPD